MSVGDVALVLARLVISTGLLTRLAISAVSSLRWLGDCRGALFGLSSNHSGDLVAGTPGKSLIYYSVVVRIWTDFEIRRSSCTVGFAEECPDDTEETFADAGFLFELSDGCVKVGMYHFLLLANDCLEIFKLGLEKSEIVDMALKSRVPLGRLLYNGRIDPELGWGIGPVGEVTEIGERATSNA